MDRMLLAAAAVLGAAISLPAQAVYKCTGPGGRVSYQDAPCAGAGKVIDVRPSRAAAPVAADAAIEAKSAAARIAAAADRFERERLDGDAVREIAYWEREIDKAEAERDRALAAIDARRANVNNNLAGATLEQSLMIERQTVMTRYRDIIDDHRREIAKLRAKRAALAAQP